MTSSDKSNNHKYLDSGKDVHVIKNNAEEHPYLEEGVEKSFGHEHRKEEETNEPINPNPQ